MTAQPQPRDPRADGAARATDLPPGDWPAHGSVPVAVLIPVKNEEANIVECLRHVLWAQQLVVVDSQSTDRTVPLAQAMGAEVYQFHYSPEGWPKKKNWALESVPWRHEWVLIVDADEHITPELAAEIAVVVHGERRGVSPPSPSVDGYHLNRRFMFMGRWIKHCGYYPSWNVRLFKHRLGRYERIGNLGDTGSGDNEVHEHVVLTTGEAGYLKNDFLHFAYPDLATWVEKHNRYSTWEMHAMLAGDSGGLKASPFGGPIERRRWLKATARRLPFRPVLRFLYAYVLKGGIFDGYPGYCMCRLLAWYEFMSSAKHYEMTRREAGAMTDAGKRHVSPWTMRAKVGRVLWSIAGSTLFRLSPQPCYRWRNWLLRRFGATIHPSAHIRPSVAIEIPWHLTVGRNSSVGDHAILYCLAPVTLGDRVTVSQYAHLCAGTHDHTRRSMPLVPKPIAVEDDVWIAAEVFVGPGVRVGAGTVVGARSSVFTDLPPWKVCVGTPARPVSERVLKD